MPIFMRDGSIIPQAFMVGTKPSYYKRARDNTAIVKARVDEILYTDDDRNSTKNTNNPQVEYVCTVLGGNENGRRLYNVKSVTPLGSGSWYNSGEVVHTPRIEDTPKDKDGDQINQPEKTSGAVVLISRVHGFAEAGTIIGNLKHPKSKGATKEDGQRMMYEFGGVKFEINKDGEFSMSFGGGPKDKDGKPADEEKAGGTISLNKDGQIKLSDGDGQEFIIDKANKKIKMNSSQGVEMGAGANWKIDVSGNVDINAGGTMNLGGSIMSLGGGGLQAARINDVVLGTDSMGGPINAFIAFGSSTVLIGG